MNTAEPTTIALPRAALALQVALAVKAAVLTARKTYAQANRRVQKNVSKGRLRPFGKRKLLLSMDELQVHMQAVESRRTCHRQLLVLAPVNRMLSVALQHPGAFELDGEATKRIVNFLGAWEIRAQQGSPEMAALCSVVSASQEFFKGTRPVTSVLAQLRETDKARLRRKLLDKLNPRNLGLSDQEQAALREALDLWVSR